MLNTSLVRMHRIIAAIYAAVFLFIVYAVVTRSNSSWAGLWILGFIAAVPVGLHLLAASGAGKGANWGKTISRVLGFLLLFGFPIGTIVGGVILVRTGAKEWQS